MPRKRTDTLDEKIIWQFSQGAKAVIALSQKYALPLGEIHMEHLFFALVDLDTTITRMLLRRSNLSRDQLVSAMSKNVKFDVPTKPFTAPDLDSPIRVSAHVAEAIREADEFRQANGNRQMLRTRHLLVGLLSVSDCEVVHELEQLGINREKAVLTIGVNEQGQGESSGTDAAPSQDLGDAGLRATTVDDILHILERLINGTDDERQELINRIAAGARTVDYSLLRDQLIAGLTIKSPEDEARTWIMSALSYLSGPNDTEVVTLLRESFDPIRERSEFVRFWSAVALLRVTGKIPEELILPNDVSGPIGMIAEAFGARRTDQVPNTILVKLQGGNEQLVWPALLVLRIVAFPSLIPTLCHLIQQANKNSTSMLPYSALLALAHPDIIDQGARTLESALGTHDSVENAVRAVRNSNFRRVSEFGRILSRFDKEGVQASLDEFVKSSDEKTSQAAHVLMERLHLPIGRDEIAPVAGYASDSIPDQSQGLKDEIGINKDVKTLCSVLLAREVSPPLAVGLFGDWGTGKSYFMEKMYREIENLSTRAKTATKSAYHSKVVQIRFNAWHYTDSSLWASLVSHIFDELARKVSPREDPEETKRKLMAQLESAKQVRLDAEAEQKRARAEKDSAETSLKTARDEREKKQVALANLRMPDMIDTLDEEDQKKLKAELQELMNALGLPAALNSIRELNNVYQDAFSLAGRIQAAFLSLWRSTDRRVLVILILVAFVLVPTASLVIENLLHAPGTAAVNSLIADVTVAIGSFTVAFKKNLKTVSDNLTKFESARDRVLKVVAAKRETISREELTLRLDLEKLRAEETAAQQRVAAADSKVRELEQKIQEINEGRSLSKFLLERVQAEDYRKHLGIISLIRKDFERLSDLLSEGGGGLEQIGRIILYIDDLDRCPADKVVDVLQATHLLLAMPLFVAVVGVDLRWLLHSLDQQYSAFRAGEMGDNRNMRPEWITSPQSYLEKIFQIPFNLRPMDASGYGKLISSLFPDARHAPSPTVDKQALSAGSGGKESPIGEQAAPPAPADSQNALLKTSKTQLETDTTKGTSDDDDKDRDLNPAALIITKREREFAARLFPFVPSPRAAKRFANTYRILKAPLTAYELREFGGTEDSPGEFQAAMLLLAFATGLPRQTTELFPAILASAGSAKSWREIVETYVVEPDMVEVLNFVKLDNMLDSLVKWTPRVARFTFEAAKSTAARSGRIEPLASS
jgi:hypothetical protein